MKSLHNLIDKATRAVVQQDRQMKQVISRIVPATTLNHINFCRLEAGRLRITVDNATWIAKLRFSERQIVGALREAKLDVVTLSFHVAPAETPVMLPADRTVSPASNAAAKALISLATHTAQPPGPQSELENTRASSVRKPDDRLRQELLKLAAKLKEEP